MANCLVNYFRYFLFMKRKERKIIDNDYKVPSLVYVTVVFNCSEYIRYQIELLNKFEENSFHLWVVDNSTNEHESKIIEEYVRKENMSYVRVPTNDGWYKNSMSHAMALNWFVKKILMPKNYKYAVFLDHDIFPVKPISFLKSLEKQKIYGVLQTRIEKNEKRWYLWPGLCGFHKSYFGRLDFRVTSWGDTGSSSYNTIYQDLNLAEMRFPKECAKWIGELSESTTNLNEWRMNARKYLEEAIELYDEQWLHFGNGSNWAKLEISKKNKYIIQCLDEVLQNKKMQS